MSNLQNNTPLLENKSLNPNNTISPKQHESKNMSEILTHFKSLQTNLEKKLDTQQNLIEQMQLDMLRPAFGTDYVQNSDCPHHLAFKSYLRRGDESSLRQLETKALSKTVDADGGYLVSPQVSSQINKLLNNKFSLRNIANIVQTRNGSVEFLVDYGEFGASWVGETATRSETTTTTLEKITIPAHEISAMPKATQRLLDDSAFDLETWIADRVAEKFTLTENSAFISGDGTDKPKGILSQTMIANTSWSWGKIGYIPTGNPSSFTSTNQHDVLIDVIYALKADYRAGAVWIMNSKTASTIRKFKDAEGRYLWNEGGDATQQANLLGYPVFISENMPNLGTDTYPILFGNFSLGYTIVDGQDIRTLRDPYSAKPHILFYTTKRVGGNVTNFEAIKALKCATT